MIFVANMNSFDTIPILRTQNGFIRYDIDSRDVILFHRARHGFRGAIWVHQV